MKKSPLLLTAFGLLLIGTTPAMAAPPALDSAATPPYMLHVQDDDGKSLADMWDKHERKGKEDRRAKWEEERQKIEAMSEEERAAYLEEKAEKHRARMMERIEKLPPEKQEEARAKLEEMEARKRAMREELMALPPEEREARMKEMREEYHAKRQEKMQEKFEKRWENADAADKAAFCEKTASHCADKGDEGRGKHLCDKAAAACATLE